MTDAPKENLSTSLYERRPAVWWAVVVVMIAAAVSCLVKAGCVAAS